MRKKLFTFLLALVTSVGMSWAWTSGDCTVTLDAGVVTVSGPGAMGNYTYFTQTPWYSSRNSITSIIIEDGVTNVGDYAFMRLDNLQSVVIGNNVVTIGSHAFEQCGSSFTSLTLGNSIVEIGEKAFINNSRITSINLPNTLQTIGEDAFYGCTRISSLTIPSSVTSIGDYAFGGCSLIAYIIAEPTTPPSTEENTFISIVTPSYIPLYVPNGSVAAYTAADRWNTFNIQGYDPSMGPTIEPVPATPDQLSGAFTINGDGDQINFSKGNLQYVGSWQFAENQWNIIGNDQADDNRDLFGWGTGDAPNKVSTTLADYAVYHEWGTNMGDGWYTLSRDEWTYLFQSRTNAANLYAPARVNGVSGFVILPDEFTLPSGLSFTAGVTNYGTNFYANAAWRAMENAGAVFLPVDGYRYDGNKIKWVGQDGFYWSSTVASEGASAWSWLISASNGARRDYYNLHYGMSVRLVKAAAPSGGSTPSNACGDGLTWELNGGVLTISYDGVGTGEMTDFDYEYESPVNVAPWKENKSEITTVVIGDGVKSIGNYAFNDLSENFTAVTIANSVERIGLNAFLNAEEITEITLPSSLKTIDERGFANCGFTSITIPSGVTSIGYQAFCYCKGLTSLTCEATTPPTLDDGVFYKITSKTSDMSSIPLYVPSENVDDYKNASQWNAFNVQAISGGSTPTPSVNAARFVYNYDCQRSPAFPKVNNACTLSGFKDPYEGYKGYNNGNIAVGPWKLEFVAYYTPSNSYGCEARVTSAVNQYFMTLSNEEKEAKKLEVPIFRLWQYNLTEREYQPATYGIVCAYAGEANAQDHAALFISSNNMGCFLSGHQHTTSFALTCENDLTTGLDALVAAASASDPELDAIQPIIVSIDAIGTVVLSDYCKYLIEGSRAAYNALTDEQKAQITNYSTLTDAEAQWAALVAAAQPYANAVIDLINAIPNPVVYTQDCKDAIDAAQAAYDALTDNQKYLVTNTETLLQAPTAFVSAAPYVNIIFTADNSNVKRIENVTLPKEFTSGDYSSEIVAIIKELYDIDEEYMMYWYNSSDRNAVEPNSTTWTVNPFVGTVTVNGALRKADYTPKSFNVDITLELPPFGPTPTPTDEQVVTNQDPENPGVYYYSTFFHSTQNYKLTNDGTTAFIADLSGNDLVLTEIAHGEQVIPKGTAVILRKNGSADPVVLNPTEENGASFNPEDNDLRGVDDATTLESLSIDPLQCYVLSGKSHDETVTGVGFYRIYGNTLKAHKAYVIFAGGQNNAPRRMRFIFDQATGMENVQGDKVQSTKLIENGVLYIIRDGVRYNAQGQVVK